MQRDRLMSRHVHRPAADAVSRRDERQYSALARDRLGKEYVDNRHISTVLAVGSGCLVLPYLLLAAPAGYLADRFSKRDVIVKCKLAEIVIMALAIGAILIGNMYLMFSSSR